MTINRKISLINFYDSNRSKSAIKYIILHYVGAVSTAKNNADYFYSKYRGASAHYFVDENEIWQVVEDNDSAWSIGADKYYTDARNTNSINIEMCCYTNSKGKLDIKESVIEKAIELTKELMKKYDIDVDHVIMHYDATRKVCPAPFVNDENRWTDFKSKLGQADTSEKEDTTVLEWQKMMNEVYNCGLAEDNSYGPDSRAKALKYYLYYKIPTIRGDRAEHVKFIQNRLCKHGYKVAVDGSFGPDSEAKTKQFQKAKGITVDGYVGADTTELLLK